MTESDDTKKRVAIYSRVSTQKQLDRTEYDSMQSHLDRCKHYILAQENWELVKVYEDPAESGDKWEREKLQEMLFDVRHNNIDVLVTFKLDRISRIVRQFHEILTILDENDVALVSVTQGFDTSTPAGKLLRNILIDFAQFERDMISERVKEKRLARAEKGLWNGGGVPFGYRAKNKKLVIVPKEVKIIKGMFDIYVETKSKTRVREHLDMMGAKTRAGTDFSKGTVEKILSNPIYAGFVTENGQQFPGIHEAIIDKDTFWALNQMEPRRLHTRTTKTDKVYLLKGLVKCSDHNCLMTPYYVQKKNNKQIHYYQCTKYAHYKKSGCKVRNINAEKLEGYTVKRIQEISEDRDQFEAFASQVNLDLEGQKEPMRLELTEVNARIKDLSTQLDNLIEMAGRQGQDFVNELFAKRVEKITKQLKGLEKKKGDLTLMLARSPSEINAQIVLESIKEFMSVYEEFSNQDRATFLNLIIEDITVYPDKVHIRIHTLPEIPTVLTGSKNRLSWLPTAVATLTGSPKILISFNSKLFHGDTPEKVTKNRPTIKDLLALAERYEQTLKQERLTKSQLAKREGMTRARMTQIMNLLKLAPEIRESIESLENPDEIKLYTERKLRKIAVISDNKKQQSEFQKLIDRK